MSFVFFPGLTAAATPVFPALATETYPRVKTPVFAISQSKTVSGRIDRLRRQCFPLFEFEIPYQGLRDQTENQTPLSGTYPAHGFTEWRQLVEQLYDQCFGQFGQFWYSDPDDCSRLGALLATAGTVAVPNNTLVPTTDGTSTLYVPMVPYNGLGGIVSYMPVGGINTGQAVTVHGTAISHTLGGPDGRSIQFTSAPAAGLSLTADLFFYHRCHFTSDATEWAMWAAGITQGTLKFRSVKP